MITNLESFVLSGDTFKQAKTILYDDLISSDVTDFKVNNFEKPSKVICVKTDFKNYYFKHNDRLDYVDFLVNSTVKDTAETIYEEDILIIKQRPYVYAESEVDLNKFLFLSTYDYSISFDKIVSKYQLPKQFLLKALTTGCPDEEYPNAKDLNLKLQKVLDDNGLLDIEDLKSLILETFTHKISKTKLKITKQMLDLIYLCITGSFELVTHTTVKLLIKDRDIFESVMRLLCDLDISQTVYNDIYNDKITSTVIVNSSFIYKLFKQSFNNFNFLLNLSKPHASHLISRLQRSDSFIFNNEEALSYVQEFLFRLHSFYGVSSFGTYFCLIRLDNIFFDKEHLHLKITGVETITESSTLISIE